jgi:hypothetical protein
MADFADATSSLPYDGGEAVVGGVILMELEKQNNDYESGLAEVRVWMCPVPRMACGVWRVACGVCTVAAILW